MKKFISVLLVMLILPFTMFGTFVSAAPQQNPSLNFLVFGASSTSTLLQLTREIGLSQKVDIAFYMLVGTKNTLSELVETIENDKVFCSDLNTGSYYYIDKSKPGGSLTSHFTHSTKISKLFGKYKFDGAIYTPDIKNSTNKAANSSSILLIQKSINKYTDKEIKTYWHEIWSLEKSQSVPKTNAMFAEFDNNWQTMQQVITDDANAISKDVDSIISVGKAFTIARTQCGYNPDNSSKSLMANEDGGLNTEGRYLAALVWYMTLTGCKIQDGSIGTIGNLTAEDMENLVNIATMAVEQSGIELKNKDEVFPPEDTDDKTTSSELIYTPEDNLNAPNNDLVMILAVGSMVVAVLVIVVVILIKKKRKT